MRARPLIAVVCLILLTALVIWFYRHRNAQKGPAAPPSEASTSPSKAPSPSTTPFNAPTNVYAHNLLLRKGPQFRIYVRWLRGEMARTHKNVDPSFDDPDSFYLKIDAGVIRANIGDLNNYLNTATLANSPLKNISFSGDGNQVKLRGTLHKVVPLPIELTGTVSALPDDRIQIHVTKLNVLKIPIKGLLGDFHVKLSDLFHPAGIAGIQVTNNDIFFDPQTLLPPPHIRGHLTKLHIVNPDLEEVYGNAETDVTRVEQWRNFLRLRDGTIDFGKLTMHHVDLVMIDISNDAWFDLDLNNYQDQLVNGYTRMTPQAGLQIFMPDVDKIPKKPPNVNVSIEWMKNRNAAPPADIYSK